MRKKVGCLFQNLSLVAITLAAAGFFPTVILNALMNGSALQGYILDGQHFVCNRDNCHEVWPFFYNISWFVGVFTFSWGFVGFCCAVVGHLLLRKFFFQKAPPLDEAE